jgi:hypothetical protein
MGMGCKLRFYQEIGRVDGWGGGGNFWTLADPLVGLDFGGCGGIVECRSRCGFLELVSKPEVAER